MRRAVLFGSYAKGCAAPKSDVDLTLDSGLRGLAFVGLMGEVRDALQKEVDCFDVFYVKPGSRVANEIEKTGGADLWRISTRSCFGKFWAISTKHCIPWHHMYYLRNRIVHDYEGIDFYMIWDIIRQDLPGLKEQLEQTLQSK